MTTASNWGGNYRFTYDEFLEPGSVEELQSAVAASDRLRVQGSLHSFNGIADGTRVVSLSRLTPELTVAEDRSSVTVSGWLTYADVVDHLDRHSLALHNLASLPHISVAGAIATATHGSGNTNGNLATAVSGLQLVTADGSLVDIRRDDADFAGHVVHLGALGVVTAVTLDVEPAYVISQRVFDGLGWDDLLARFDAISAAGYSVSVFTRWGHEAGSVWVKSREPAAGPDIPGARPATGERHPIPDLDPVNCTAQLGVLGPWHDRLPHFRAGATPSAGNEIQSEFHLPRHCAADAITALRGCGNALAPVLQVSEIRTVAADDLWMSPQYGQDTVSFHFTWEPDNAAVRAALRTVEAALAPFDPRPHWGKVFLDDGPPPAARYPMSAAFAALVERMDPTGTFGNPWLRQAMGSLSEQR